MPRVTRKSLKSRNLGPRWSNVRSGLRKARVVQRILRRHEFISLTLLPDWRCIALHCRNGRMHELRRER